MNSGISTVQLRISTNPGHLCHALANFTFFSSLFRLIIKHEAALAYANSQNVFVKRLWNRSHYVRSKYCIAPTYSEVVDRHFIFFCMVTDAGKKLKTQHIIKSFKSKSNLHYIRGSTPKRESSRFNTGATQLQKNVAAFDDTMFRFDRPGN